MIQNELIKAEDDNYLEKLERLRTRRDQVFNQVMHSLSTSLFTVEGMEATIFSKSRVINAALKISGVSMRLAILKPRRSGFGFSIAKLGKLNLAGMQGKKSEIALITGLLRDLGVLELEAQWIAGLVHGFACGVWAEYKVVTDNYTAVINGLVPGRGEISTKSFEEVRLDRLSIGVEVLRGVMDDLQELDQEFDDLVFEINSIGGKYRGYRSVICRWQLSAEKNRYPIRVLMSNPEIAFIAWNIGARRIVRPITKIKGVGESGFITERLIKHLRQRRNAKKLRSCGAKHKELSIRRSELLETLEQSIQLLGEVIDDPNK